MIALHATEPPPLTIARVEEPGPEDLATDADIAATRGTTEAPAPAATTDDAQLTFESIESSDARLDEICERLAWWVHTRKLFGAPRGPVSLLGKLRTGTRALKPGGGRDAACSTLLPVLYIAVLRQPADALDRQVFEMHYLHRVTNVKSAAAALGIGRQHWYTLLRSFRRRIYSIAVDTEAQNMAEAAALKTRVS